jgi:cephalosporin hydroxylase
MSLDYKTRALQNLAEFAAFCDILKHERCDSYLEIGSRHGGSLWLAGQALQSPAKIVSVELPDSHNLLSLDACLRNLRAMGHRARLVLGDSTDPAVIDNVRGQGLFDAVLIDANHTMPFVKSDWEHYGPLARKLVAFHDISWKGPRPGKLPVDVPALWQLLKPLYRHIEITHEQRDNGIGVLFKQC